MSVSIQLHVLAVGGLNIPVRQHQTTEDGPTWRFHLNSACQNLKLMKIMRKHDIFQNYSLIYISFNL